MTNTSKIPYVIKTNGSVTLYLKGECLTVAPDHPNYTKIVDAIKADDFSNIDSLVNVAVAVTKYAGDRVTITDGVVFYGTFEVHNSLADRIVKMMNEGFKFDHMVKFLENLMQNPSARAVSETYWFLENYGLPITDDGCFLAYKAVRNDYKDIYSGKYDNSVGAKPFMLRNQVDDNYDVDCSKGLHVGALDYVVQYGHFSKGQPRAEGGNRLLIVKVNPKDVVSVPKYAGHTKMRVCEYTVVNEILDVVKELDKVVYTSTATALSPDWSGQDEDYDATDISDDSCVYDDEDDSTDDDGEFDDGFSLGVKDREEGLEYQASLDVGDTEAFKDGYFEGYNNF
jgi:hypothetical protein